MHRLWLTFLLSHLVISDIQCAKILAVFPTPSISHQVVFRPYVHELVRRGHEVVVLTPNPAFPKGEAPTNLTEIDVHDISYEHFESILSTHDGDKSSILQQFVNMYERLTTTFEKQLQTPEFQRVLKEEKDTFDLIVVEAIVRASLGLGHLLKKPIIQFSSLGGVSTQYDIYGAPVQPVIFPTALNQRVYNLNMLEKLWEYFKYLVIEYLNVVTYEFDHSMGRRHFGEDMPPYKDLFDKYVQLLFLNDHSIWRENHPLPPNVVLVGGIYKAPEKELPKDLQQYLDSSKRGIIYVSFGSNVRTKLLPPEKVALMVNAFSQLPYDVLWKWDEDKMVGNSENIKISKWLPQAQLLKHPKIKLFVTQGGLQSTEETLEAAVPVIGIPMLGDQWYNTEKYAHHKIGLQLDLHSITEDSFRDAVKTVIEDKSYKQNILHLRTLLRQHPMEPLDLSIWWTEYVLRFGGKHLRSPATLMPWTEYYEIKLILVLFTVLFVFTSITILVVYTIIRFILRRLNRKLKIS